MTLSTLDGRAWAYLSRMLDGRGSLTEVAQRELETRAAYTLALLGSHVDQQTTDLFAFRTAPIVLLSETLEMNRRAVVPTTSKRGIEVLRDWVGHVVGEYEDVVVLLHDWAGSHELAAETESVVMEGETHPGNQFAIVTGNQVFQKLEKVINDVETQFLMGVLLSGWTLPSGKFDQEVFRRQWLSVRIRALFASAYDGEGYVCWKAQDT